MKLSLSRHCLLLWVFLLMLSGCHASKSMRQSKISDWVHEKEKLKVLSTTEMIHCLVQSVGGIYVNSIPLVYGELDPHTYQFVKGDEEKIQSAELIFYNGLGLEHGPSLYNYLKGSEKSFALGDHLKREHPEKIIYIEGQSDPHVWMDMALWSETLYFIAETLSEKMPERRSEFELRAGRVARRLRQTHRILQEKMSRVPSDKRYLVTSHDAFNYFARAYLTREESGKGELWKSRLMAPEGLAPESQISLKQVQKIVDYLKEYQVNVVFPEANVSQDSLKKIQEAVSEYGQSLELCCEPLYADSMSEMEITDLLERPEDEYERYEEMLTHNIDLISSYLGGWRIESSGEL